MNVSCNSINFFSTLPNEMVGVIWSYLDISECDALRLTCKRFCKLTNQYKAKELSEILTNIQKTVVSFFTFIPLNYREELSAITASKEIAKMETWKEIKNKSDEFVYQMIVPLFRLVRESPLGEMMIQTISCASTLLFPTPGKVRRMHISEMYGEGIVLYAPVFDAVENKMVVAARSDIQVLDVLLTEFIATGGMLDRVIEMAQNGEFDKEESSIILYSLASQMAHIHRPFQEVLGIAQRIKHTFWRQNMFPYMIKEATFAGDEEKARVIQELLKEGDLTRKGREILVNSLITLIAEDCFTNRQEEVQAIQKLLTGEELSSAGRERVITFLVNLGEFSSALDWAFLLTDPMSKKNVFLELFSMLGDYIEEKKILTRVICLAAEIPVELQEEEAFTIMRMLGALVEKGELENLDLDLTGDTRERTTDAIYEILFHEITSQEGSKWEVCQTVCRLTESFELYHSIDEVPGMYYAEALLLEEKEEEGLKILSKLSDEGSENDHYQCLWALIDTERGIPRFFLTSEVFRLVMRHSFKPLSMNGEQWNSLKKRTKELFEDSYEPQQGTTRDPAFVALVTEIVKKGHR